MTEAHSEEIASYYKRLKRHADAAPEYLPLPTDLRPDRCGFADSGQQPDFRQAWAGWWQMIRLLKKRFGYPI